MESFLDDLDDDICCVLRESLRTVWDFVICVAATVFLGAALFGFPVWLTFRGIAIRDMLLSAIKVITMRR